MTFRLGLTGSIGMGKSTTAGFFADAGIPVWDADAAVHRLYASAAVAPMAAAFPDAVTDHVDRTVLKRIIAADPTALPRIEAIIHPLVAADRDSFIRDMDADLILLDIPLLFEKGTEAFMDATLVVTAPPALQRARVLARPDMTDAALAKILERQMPDAEKRARATHIIETLALDATRAQVHALIDYIRKARDA